MTEDTLKIDAEKTAFNARAKAAMRKYLRSKTWPEKIASIERMDEAAKLAREGMRKAGNKGTRDQGNKKAGEWRFVCSQFSTETCVPVLWDS